MTGTHPFELLHQVAGRLDAVVTLTVDADRRDSRSGRRPLSAQEGARLSTLAVVRPRPRAVDRWDALNRGDVLVAHVLHPDDLLDTVAAAFVDELAPLLAA